MGSRYFYGDPARLFHQVACVYVNFMSTIYLASTSSSPRLFFAEKSIHYYKCFLAYSKDVDNILSVIHMLENILAGGLSP